MGLSNAAAHLPADSSSTIRRLAGGHQDQRRAKGDWAEEKGQPSSPATQGRTSLTPQAKEDATELLATKAALEKERKELEEAAAAKERDLNKKIGTIGNYVDNSVPVSNDEVGRSLGGPPSAKSAEQQRPYQGLGA